MEKRERNIIWRGLITFERTIIAWTAIGVTIIVALACICRYFLDADLKAYEEYLLPVAFWLYMMGGVYGSYEKSHITADILNIYLKEGKAKDTVRFLKLLFTFILGAIFTWWAFQYVLWGIQMGTKTAVWRIPHVIGQGSIFVGLSLMSMYNLVYLYDDIVLLVKKYGKSGKNKIGDNQKKEGINV